MEEIILKRAIRKLALTFQVLEKGHFAQDESGEPSASDEIQEMIKFGLKNIFDSEDSTISDDDIDTILGNGQSVDELQGELLPLSEPKETQTSDNMYDYMGVDYSKPSTQDAQIFEELAQEEKKKVFGDETVSLRKRKLMYTKEELEEHKRQRKEERKLKKWEKHNYTSKEIVLPSQEDEAASKEEELQPEENEAENDIHFVTGDASKPQGSGNCNAIIINCLDNSGEWGFGGFFDAISKLSKLPQQEYEQAKEMGDLELGGAHLVEIGDRDEEGRVKLYVVNAIVQKFEKKNNTRTFSLQHLKFALDKVAFIAKKLHGMDLKINTIDLILATVHLPRVGAGANWYSTERTIRAALVAKDVETYIYYFKRTHHTSTTSTHQSPYKQRSNSPAKIYKNKPSSQDLSGELQIKEPSKSLKPKGDKEETASVDLPDYFNDLNFLLVTEDANARKEAKRYIVAYPLLFFP